MSRPASRVRHDEVYRSVKAVQKTGLSVCRVDFEETASGINWSVIIGDVGDNASGVIDGATKGNRPKEVETL